MRAAVVALAVTLVLSVLLPLVNALAPRRRREIQGDALVKDPVCETYIVRSRAVTRRFAEGLRHFCSAECARRYAG
ncbi:MAG TPA: hypothetical protein VNN07_10975, partial [Candidatus Tectomicrobia bacterium]|nr:hypothetical protein [Candidatus Tectomicrobia bacterium]